MDVTVMPPDQNHGPVMLGILCTFAAVTFMLVVVKTCTRVQVIKETGLDNIFVLLSAVNPEESNSSSAPRNHSLTQ